jgi:hypothetical protein
LEEHKIKVKLAPLFLFKYKSYVITNLLFSIILTFSCNYNQEEKTPPPIKDSIHNLSADVVGLDNSNEPFNLRIIEKIDRDSDAGDSLLKMYKHTMGTIIDSLAPDAYIINYWYGGSYEDIFVYMKTGVIYSNVLTFSGTPGFKVLSESNFGVHSFQIINKREKVSAKFIYDGNAFSTFEIQGKHRLNDINGLGILEGLDIKPKFDGSYGSK